MIVRWTGRARADIDAIWLFIAEDDIDAADRLARIFRDTATTLEQFPKQGRKGKLPGTRELIIAGTPYRLIYRIESRMVQILHVVHGAQDWPRKR